MGKILDLLISWIKRIVDFIKWAMRFLGGPDRPAAATKTRQNADTAADDAADHSADAE